MTRLAPSFAIAMVASAGAAQAQETGSLRPDTAPIEVAEGSKTGDAARAIYDDFALCIVKRHYVQVRKALAGPPDLARDNETLPKLMDKECFFGSDAVRRVGGLDSVQMTTNPLAFRGALYKALVRRDFARRPVAFAPAAVAIEGDNAEVLRRAACVVRRDPDGSLKLLGAKAGSNDERTASEAVLSQAEPCNAQGLRTIPKGILIGFLAEAYYREAEASKSKSSH